MLCYVTIPMLRSDYWLETRFGKVKASVAQALSMLRDTADRCRV